MPAKIRPLFQVSLRTNDISPLHILFMVEDWHVEQGSTSLNIKYLKYI